MLLGRLFGGICLLASLISRWSLGDRGFNWCCLGRRWCRRRHVGLWWSGLTDRLSPEGLNWALVWVASGHDGVAVGASRPERPAARAHQVRSAAGAGGLGCIGTPGRLAAIAAPGRGVSVPRAAQGTGISRLVVVVVSTMVWLTPFAASSVGRLRGSATASGGCPRLRGVRHAHGHL